MRLLIVTNMWPSPADPVFGVFVRQQVEDLRALDPDLQVEVFAFDGRPSKLVYLRAVSRLRRLLATRGDELDLIHAHYVLSGLVALLAGARRHAPLVVTHHGIEVFEGWQAPLARWVSRRADKTLVISRAMARHLGLGQEAVLPCGIDLRRFRPGPRAVARRQLGLPAPPSPIVVWVGVDRPEKRLWLARAAVEALRARPGFSETRLHIVTHIPPETVPLHLQAADVVLVTSTREGGPLAVKEALAAGRPVVSVEVGDVAEVLEGVEGCVVVPNRPDLRDAGSDGSKAEAEAGALADSLAEALAKALRRSLDGDPSEEPVDASTRVSRYDAARIARRLRAIYAELAGETLEPAGAEDSVAQDGPPAHKEAGA